MIFDEYKRFYGGTVAAGETKSAGRVGDYEVFGSFALVAALSSDVQSDSGSRCSD